MHQFAQKLGGPWQFYAGDTVAGLRCSQVVAHRAYTADALGNGWHLKVGATFSEFLQTAEFINVKEGLVHLALFIQIDSDPSMTFDTRYRFNGYLSSTHSYTPLIIFE
jgi:hypothetical protein